MEGIPKTFRADYSREKKDSAFFSTAHVKVLLCHPDMSNSRGPSDSRKNDRR